MARHRRGLAHRFIALLTAAVMPLCCCVIDAGASCCIPAGEAPIIEVTSCCSSQECQPEQAETPADEAPCSDADCSCCLKAPVNSVDWTPPVDTIGTALPPFSLGDLVAESEVGQWAANAWNDPPPKPGGVDALRGLVILQV